MHAYLREKKTEGKKEGRNRTRDKEGGMMNAVSKGVCASAKGSCDKDERANEIKENRKAVADFQIDTKHAL